MLIPVCLLILRPLAVFRRDCRRILERSVRGRLGPRDWQPFRMSGSWFSWHLCINVPIMSPATPQSIHNGSSDERSLHYICWITLDKGESEDGEVLIEWLSSIEKDMIHEHVRIYRELRDFTWRGERFNQTIFTAFPGFLFIVQSYNHVNFGIRNILCAGLRLYPCQK